MDCHKEFNLALGGERRRGLERRVGEREGNTSQIRDAVHLLFWCKNLIFAELWGASIKNIVL